MNNIPSEGKASGGVQLAGTYRWLGSLLTAALLGTISPTAYGSTHIIAGVKGQNNGAQTAHFTASYPNGAGGTFIAAGERIVKTGPNPFTKDSETILMSDISSWPAGKYSIVDGVLLIPMPGMPGMEFAISWFSDFDSRVAQSGTIVVTDNGDGTGTLNATFYY
jgi:hypothetical protein